MTETGKKVIKLRNRGYSYRKIANILSVSYTTVQYWLNPKCKKNIIEYSKKNSKKYYNKYKNEMNYRCRVAIEKSEYRKHNKNSIKCSASIDELKDAFTGFCHICGKSENDLKQRLCMDHCHRTGQFRGWLCHNCNQSIGKAEDNVQILEKMINYLNKFL